MRRMARSGCITAPCRSQPRRAGFPPAFASGLFLLLLSWVSRADEIRFRDGTVQTGRVLSVQSSAYLFQPARPQPMQTIPKNAVQYVLYDNSAQADHVLGISAAAQRHTRNALSAVRLLPTRPFGKTILETAQNAKTSIWISAYYISGSSISPIKDFYDTLVEKARQGLEVVILSEYGPGTSARVREATYDFACEMERAGIRVLFTKEYRILHKKLILVDDEVVLLGSANLTMAGTLQSDEMNVEIRQPAFVASVRRDLERLFARALAPEAPGRKGNKP